MRYLTRWLEESLFGVCEWLGDKMGIASSRVRLYFIYASFATLGSPVLLYLIAAFWLNVRRYMRRTHDWLWE